MKNRIVALRKTAKLTQGEFAKKLGVSDKSVQAWEYGYNLPSKAMLSVICSVFNVNREWLETGEGEMLKPSSTDVVDRLLEEYHGNDTFRRVLEAYLRLDPYKRELADAFLEMVMAEKNGAHKDTMTGEDLTSPSGQSPTDAELAE